MSTFKAAAIQLNSQPDLSYSMKQAYIAVEKAARRGATFIGLPENFAFLGDEYEKRRQSRIIHDVVMESIPRWANEFDVYLLAGGFPVPAEIRSTERIATPDKIYNRSMLVGPDGRMIHHYDKIHLFDVALSDSETYRESDTVMSGKSEAAVAQTDLGKDNGKGANIGLSICYDIRFPELYRLMGEKHVDLITIPSAFTRPTGEAHWDVLLRARAIENVCYVIAPAQTGLHGKSRETYGHAMIIDPWGRVLSDAGISPGIAIADMNPNRIKETRRKLPALTHRKL